MFRLIKALIYLAILGFIGLSAYAYVGLKTPVPQMTQVPVTLNVN